MMLCILLITQVTCQTMDSNEVRHLVRYQCCQWILALFPQGRHGVDAPSVINGSFSRAHSPHLRSGCQDTSGDGGCPGLFTSERKHLL